MIGDEGAGELRGPPTLTDSMLILLHVSDNSDCHRMIIYLLSKFQGSDFISHGNILIPGAK
jgi:hypothetical protein